MTQEEARAARQQYGSYAAAAKALGVSASTLRDRAVGGRPGIRASAAPPSAAGSETSGGISLASVRTSVTRPSQDTTKQRLYHLIRGRGYPLTELAKEWGLSDETLRKHARRFEALIYAEVRPGEWVACVVHPDTGAEHGKGRP